MIRVLLIFVFTIAAVLGLMLVRRRVGVEVLREHHDVAGVSFAVIGGFYGVLLAFVLVASWERFERARAYTDVEANAVGDIYRQADALPPAARASLRGQLRNYVSSVIELEWPAMDSGELAPATQNLYFHLWETVLQMNPETSKDVALYQVMLGKLDDFGEARRYRLLYMRNGLPSVIWGFMTVFGIVTVGFTYFFGMPRLLPHAIITGVLAASIACTLAIILEMQTPFGGLVKVPDRAFHVVFEFMQDEHVGK